MVNIEDVQVRNLNTNRHVTINFHKRVMALNLTYTVVDKVCL